MALQEHIYNEIFDILDEMLLNFRNFANDIIASETRKNQNAVKDRTDNGDSEILQTGGEEYREPAGYLYLCKNIPEHKVAVYNKKLESLLKEIKRIDDAASVSAKKGELVPLFYICKIFNLTFFEKICFMMAFAAESDGIFRRHINIIFDDYSRNYPTVELLSNILFTDDEIRLQSRTSFMENVSSHAVIYDIDYNDSEGNSIFRKPLKLQKRIFDFLYDVSGTDTKLESYMEICMPNDDIQEMYIHENYVSEIEKLYDNINGKSYICVRGSEGSGRKLLIRSFCKRNRVPLFLINLKKMRNAEKLSGIDDAVDAIVMESILKGNAVMAFTDLSLDEDDALFFRNLVWKLEKLTDFFFVTGSSDCADPDSAYSIVDMQVEDPDFSERVLLWKHNLEMLSERNLKTEGEVSEIAKRLSEQYRLTPKYIESACEYACLKAIGLNEDTVRTNYLVEGCRRHIRHSLSSDATKIKSVYEMDNLILPDNSKKRLEQACNYIRYKNLVYKTWGFEDKMAYGRGVSMIFYGPPGTGKTMGAQVIANMLGLELYRVELSSIMSKYVGESEKKLSNIFEQGKKSQSILFFDEADSLFGKRSEVKDSQDKYANASTAFLLQKIEDYDGIIILATNLLQNFDSAFMRRFQFVIEFPFPNEEQRTMIWRSVLPEKAPRDFIDFEYLGRQFKLSGAQIKNITLAALFLAAGDGKVIDMKYVLRAVFYEMKKNGKTLLEADFGEYYDLIKGE